MSDMLVIDLSPHFDNCCVCDVEVVNPRHGIAMYECVPVHDDWLGPWGGYAACDDCYEKHSRGELDMWMPGQEPVHADYVAACSEGE